MRNLATIICQLGVLAHLAVAQPSWMNGSVTTIAPFIYSGAGYPIDQVLSKTTISTIFNLLWASSGIQSTLTGTSYTLFVPTDSAWYQLSASDRAQLTPCLTSGSSCTQIIMYHLWSQAFTTSDFVSGGNAFTSQNAPCQTFGTDTSTALCYTMANTAVTGNTAAHVALAQANNNWYVNGAMITSANNLAQYYTVHFINKWLYPIDTGTTGTTYLATSVNNPTQSLISAGCPLCSSAFNSLWTKTTTSGAGLAQWAQLKVNSQGGAITMFIPISSAYALAILTGSSAPALSVLYPIVAAHVIPGTVLYLNRWIASGVNPACGGGTTYSQTCYLTSLGNNQYAVEVGNTGATIIYPDITVENGVVHIISNVLNYASGTLGTVVSQYPSTTKFASQVTADSTGTTSKYLTDNANAYTLFVPDDNSWTYSGVNAATMVNGNATLLQLGIVKGVTWRARDIEGQLTATNPVYWPTNPTNTLLGTGYRLRFYMGYNSTEVHVGSLNGFVATTLSSPDVAATNGIMQIVTGGIFGVPQMTIAQFLLSRYELTTTSYLLGQLTATSGQNAWQLLGSTSYGAFTVIAPTNAAWNTLAASLTLGGIVLNPVARNNLMLRFYMNGNIQLYNSLTTSGATTSATTLNGQLTFSIASTNPPQFKVVYSSSSATVTLSDFLCTNGRVHIIDTVLAVATDLANTQIGYSCQNPAACNTASMPHFSIAIMLFGVIAGLWNR